MNYKILAVRIDLRNNNRYKVVVAWMLSEQNNDFWRATIDLVDVLPTRETLYQIAATGWSVSIGKARTLFPDLPLDKVED